MERRGFAWRTKGGSVSAEAAAAAPGGTSGVGAALGGVLMSAGAPLAAPVEAASNARNSRRDLLGRALPIAAAPVCIPLLVPPLDVDGFGTIPLISASTTRPMTSPRTGGIRRCRATQFQPVLAWGTVGCLSDGTWIARRVGTATCARQVGSAGTMGEAKDPTIARRRVGTGLPRRNDPSVVERRQRCGEER